MLCLQAFAALTGWPHQQQGIFELLGFFLSILCRMQACVMYRSILLTCTLGSVLVIARQFTPAQGADNLKANVKVHLQNSRKPLSVMDLSEPKQAATMTQPRRCTRCCCIMWLSTQVLKN